MQVYPNRLNDQLSKGLQSCYLIFGDEPQQKMDCIERIRALSRQQGFDERQSLVADNQFSWNSLIEAAQSMSLFSARQLIELELPTGKPGTEGAKILAELAQAPNPDTLLVIHGPRIGKDVQNTKWFKSLDKQGCFVPCYPLEGNPLKQWIRQQLTEQGLTGTPQLADLVADFCEGNLLAAKQEIAKLALLHPEGQVTLEQAEAAMVDQSRFNVFQLIDVLLQGDAQRAVKMLYRLESEGIDPTIVLWALVREWQTLQALQFLRASGQNINWNQHRIWKNRQGFYNQALSRLTLEHLDAMQPKLAAMDRALKQSELTRPFVNLCHLCLLFIAVPLQEYPLAL